MRKLSGYIPVTLYLVAASIVINVIGNEWGWNYYALLGTGTAVIAIGLFLLPSRPLSRSR